jgi:hypothetical protein
MKNKLYFAIGVLVLLGSFVLSGRSQMAFGPGDPPPPCGPAGCLPPVR